MNSPQDHLRQQIRKEVVSILALDRLEQLHIEETLHWIDGGDPLFRVAKPATPPMHLVSYFAVVDDQGILLVDHKNAQLWLPAGGHVEPDEHPRTTVVRELSEELGFTAPHPIGPPLMLTCTATVGLTAGHTDVSLWYVVRATRNQQMCADQEEFNSICWFDFDQIPYHCSEPHLRRFVQKLKNSFDAVLPEKQRRATAMWATSAETGE